MREAYTIRLSWFRVFVIFLSGRGWRRRGDSTPPRTAGFYNWLSTARSASPRKLEAPVQRYEVNGLNGFSGSVQWRFRVPAGVPAIGESCFRQSGGAAVIIGASPNAVTGPVQRSPRSCKWRLLPLRSFFFDRSNRRSSIFRGPPFCATIRSAVDTPTGEPAAARSFMTPSESDFRSQPAMNRVKFYAAPFRPLHPC